jgi:rod shape-determining protein MreB
MVFTERTVPIVMRRSNENWRFLKIQTIGQCDCIYHASSAPSRSTEVKTNEIVKAINKELRDMIKAIKDVLQETPPELSADIIDQGIIMTGGSSMLRNFPELVNRRTGVKALLADDALFCVVKGTGIALDHLDVYKRSIISKR